jgi:hypothetical protein
MKEESKLSKMILQDLLSHAPQNSAAWDRLRLGKFTASQIHKLMSDPRSKADKEAGKLSATAEGYVIEKAIEEITGLPAHEAFGRAIDHGNEYEEEALLLLKEKLDLDPEYRFEMKPSFSLFNDHSGASADAMIHIDSKTRIGIEIKCPFNSANHFKHSQIMQADDSTQEVAEILKEIAPEYYFQVLMGCLSYRCSTWIFASYDPRMPEGFKLLYRYLHPTIDDLNELCRRIEIASERKEQILNQIKTISNQ